MAEVQEKPVVQKKRQAKPGTRRVTVNLQESEYQDLAKAAEKDMREPNILLSLMLRGEIGNLLENRFGTQ